MAKVVERAGIVLTGLPVNGDVESGDLVGWSSQKIVRAVGTAGSVVAAIGVAMASYKAGDSGAVALGAEVSGFSGLTLGGTQYLSLSAAGATQATTPSGTGSLKQKVGFAVAADRVAFTFQDEGALL